MPTMIPIRYESDGVLGITYEPPAFCGDCGKPFLWTKRRLEAARELALEAEHLSDEQRKQLAETLDDLLRVGGSGCLAILGGIESASAAAFEAIRARPGEQARQLLKVGRRTRARRDVQEKSRSSPRDFG